MQRSRLSRAEKSKSQLGGLLLRWRYKHEVIRAKREESEDEFDGSGADSDEGIDEGELCTVA